MSKKCYSEKYPLGETGGLIIIKDFITKKEENELIEYINNSKWNKSLKRWTQHYGYKYNYRSRLITQKDYIGKLPKWMNFITERIKTSKYVCESGKELNQAIINRYLPGEGINPHIDVPSIFGPTIYSLTLGSPCVMEFTKNRKRVYCYLKRCSLLIMSGQARYKYKHSIPSRLYDIVNNKKRMRGTRISITLRSMILEDENKDENKDKIKDEIKI